MCTCVHFKLHAFLKVFLYNHDVYKPWSKPRITSGSPYTTSSGSQFRCIMSKLLKKVIKISYGNRQNPKYIAELYYWAYLHCLHHVFHVYLPIVCRRLQRWKYSEFGESVMARDVTTHALLPVHDQRDVTSRDQHDVTLGKPWLCGRIAMYCNAWYRRFVELSVHKALLVTGCNDYVGGKAFSST
jgi:hypothetical protein